MAESDTPAASAGPALFSVSAGRKRSHAASSASNGHTPASSSSSSSSAAAAAAPGPAATATPSVAPGTPLADCGLPPWLVTAAAGLGMTRCTPVQAAALGAVTAGRNAILTAPTGSGKTLVYAAAALAQLAREPWGPYAVVLTSGRELAEQVGEVCRGLGAPLNVRVAVITGGADAVHQTGELERSPHIIIATPGRLAAQVDAWGERLGLHRIAMLVLDEADRLLTREFAPDLAVLMRAVPAARQTVALSATMTPTLAAAARACCAGRDDAGEPLIWHAAGSSARRAQLPSRLVQHHVFTPGRVKIAWLAALLRGGAAGASAPAAQLPAMVFVAKPKTAVVLASTLAELGLRATALHGMAAQRVRSAALRGLREGTTDVLVATDVAARGLDVPGVQLVVNYDVPRAIGDYVHRVGRTARAGAAGLAVSLVTPREVQLWHDVEEALGEQVPALTTPTEAEVMRGLANASVAHRLAEARLDASEAWTDSVTRAAARKAKSAARLAAWEQRGGGGGGE